MVELPHVRLWFIGCFCTGDTYKLNDGTLDNAGETGSCGVHGVAAVVEEGLSDVRLVTGVERMFSLLGLAPLERVE